MCCLDKKMTNLKIAVDIDGVLSKTMEYFVFHLNSTYGRNFSIHDITQYNFTSLEKYFSFSLYDELLRVIDTSLEDFKIHEHSKDILQGFKEKHSFSVLTSRSDIFGERSKKWIEKHYGEDVFEDVYTLEASGFSCKSDFCVQHNFDLLLEDQPNYALNTRDKGIGVILLCRPWNQDVSTCDLLRRAKTWKEVGELISDFEKK